MDLELKDKVAVITGGSVGIGLAVAEGLAAEGVHVVIVARQGERAHSEAARIAKTFGVLIHELVCARADLDPARATFLQAYDQAVELYRSHCWEQARQAFAAVHALAPEGKDYPSELLAAR